MLTNKQEDERQTFNKIVREKTAGKSLLVDVKQPSFANYNGDLFWGAMKLFGDLKDRRILEIGCGSGEICVWLAMHGAQVSGVDISDESIAVAKERAVTNNVADKTTFEACPGEATSFANQSFDIIFINVSLHHLEIGQALREFQRLLKSSGQLIAAEPLVFSDLIQRLRTSWAVTRMYPIRQESATERILTVRDLGVISQYFSDVSYQPYRFISPFIYKDKLLFGLLASLWQRFGYTGEFGRETCNRAFQRFDEQLLKLMPGLKLFSRYVILRAVKK